MSKIYGIPVGGYGSGTNGRSAYELAVAEGFEGTLSQWLASLVGPRGEQGPAGADAPADTYLPKDGSAPMAGDLSMGEHRLTNLGAPVSGTDAVRKQDVRLAGWMPTAEEVGAAPAGYPNASMSGVWGNWGFAKDGKFDYYANLNFSLYENGILEVYMRGQILMESPSATSYEYGIDTTAIMQKINEWTGKNFTSWQTQRTLHMELYDASTGLPLLGLIGYMPFLGARSIDNKVYLQFGRMYTTEGADGPWALNVVVNATQNGSAYLNLHLRAKLS